MWSSEARVARDWDARKYFKYDQFNICDQMTIHKEYNAPAKNINPNPKNVRTSSLGYHSIAFPFLHVIRFFMLIIQSLILLLVRNNM